MFSILWFLFIAFGVSILAVWMIDHNGHVLINWLGYELKTDIITAATGTLFLSFLIFCTIYLLLRIFAMRFPNLFKLFFKKSYTKKLETVIHRNWQGIELLPKLLLALENDDTRNAQILQNKLALYIKNPHLNNFLLAKIHYQNKEFLKASEYFEKIDDDKFSHLMALKSRFEHGLKKNDDVMAIAYAKQILSVKTDNLKIAKILLSLYQRNSMINEARILIENYGSKKFSKELKSQEAASLNTAIALDFYHKKQFGEAINYAKIALGFDEYFLQAHEIMLKSWIKRGFAFYAIWLLKKLWKKYPQLIFIDILDMANRKKTPQARLNAAKKLVALNNKTHIGDLALGVAAIRTGFYDKAREYLLISLAKEKTSRAYKALAVAEKMLGNSEESKKYFEKADELNYNDHFAFKL